MNRIRFPMKVSAQSYIDPLIDLFEVEKLPDINLTADKSPDDNKKKGLNFTSERKKALDELVAAFVFVQEKVTSNEKVEKIIRARKDDQ